MKMNTVRALIIGYGSIGARHARLIDGLDCSVAVISSREIQHPKRYANIKEGCQLHNPNYVVIANETSCHWSSILELSNIGYQGKVLVEKPIFARFQPLPDVKFSSIHVAYNLRYSPVLNKLRDLLQDQRMLSICGYVGEYLPHWRPGVDYRKSYSADSKKGGGVLLDLSHELDYICWLSGQWKRVIAVGGHLSSLEINSEDIFSLMFETEFCPIINLQLNYLDRSGRRQLIVNTVDHTYMADLKNQVLWVDNECLHFEVDRDLTYKLMHSSILSGVDSQACVLGEAVDILRLVEAAKISSEINQWITK